MVLFGVVGNIRTGKTLLAVILGYLFKMKGYTVYSNFKTSYSELVTALNVLDFELEDGVLLLDEVGTLVDSRNNSQANRLFSYFFNQSGKRGVHIIYTSQSRRLYDLRLDQITHIMYKSSRTPDGFIYKKYKNEDDGLKLTGKIFLSYEKAEPYYKMYETKEVVYAPEMNSANIMEWKEVINIFEESETKNSFEVIMRKKNPYISLNTAGAVYDYLKNGNEKRAKEILGTK